MNTPNVSNPYGFSVFPEQSSHGTAFSFVNIPSETFAGVWRRFAARILDTLILSFVSLLSIIVATKFYKADALQHLMAIFGGKSEPTSIAILACIPLSFIYFAGCDSAPWQGTPGKWLMSLRVTGLNGERISFGRASVRFAVNYLLSVLLLIPALKVFGLLGMLAIPLCVMFAPLKQAPHDMASKALVLQTRKHPLASWATCLIISFVLCIFLFWIGRAAISLSVIHNIKMYKAMQSASPGQSANLPALQTNKPAANNELQNILDKLKSKQNRHLGGTTDF